MLSNSLKRRIDSMDYETMLRLWRNSQVGDPMFQGETGEYFVKEMHKKKGKEPNPSSISKRIGW